MRVGSLFAGVGGFDLGLERAGFTVVWQSEIDPYCAAVLKKHWPHVPNLGDVRSIRRDTVEPVDVICGGFPCQPYSVAGKARGAADDRDLWPEYSRIVRECRPRWVIAENVPALRTRGYDRVHDDLEGAGYTVQPFVVGADDIGACHRRKRVWSVANAKEIRLQDWSLGAIPRATIAGRASLEPERLGSEAGAHAHTDARRLQSQRQPHHPEQQGASGRQPDRCDRARSHWQWTARDDPDAERERLAREQQAGAKTWPINRSGDERDPVWLSPVAPVIELDDGIPAGLVRHRRPALAAIGNALVPQIAEAFGRAIMRFEQCR